MRESQEVKGGIPGPAHGHPPQGLGGPLEALQVLAKGLDQGPYGHVDETALKELRPGQMAVGNPVIGHGGAIGGEEGMEEKDSKPDGGLFPSFLPYLTPGERDAVSPVEEGKAELPFPEVTAAFSPQDIGAVPRKLPSRLLQGLPPGLSFLVHLFQLYPISGLPLTEGQK